MQAMANQLKKENPDFEVPGMAETPGWPQPGHAPCTRLSRSLVFMDSLPKNAVGKIAKNEIRDRFWGDGRKV